MVDTDIMNSDVGRVLESHAAIADDMDVGVVAVNGFVAIGDEFMF